MSNYTINDAFAESHPFTDPRDNPTHREAMRKLAGDLERSSLFQDILARTIASHPLTAMAVLMNDKSVIAGMIAFATFTFEAGRLYGRSELMRELEPKA